MHFCDSALSNMVGNQIGVVSDAFHFVGTPIEQKGKHALPDSVNHAPRVWENELLGSLEKLYPVATQKQFRAVCC